MFLFKKISAFFNISLPEANKIFLTFLKIGLFFFGFSIIFPFIPFFKNSEIFLFFILYFSKILTAFLKVVGSGQQGPDAISVSLSPVTSEIIKETILLLYILEPYLHESLINVFLQCLFH